MRKFLLPLTSRFKAFYLFRKPRLYQLKYVLSECDKTGVNKNHVLSVATVLKPGKNRKHIVKKKAKTLIIKGKTEMIKAFLKQVKNLVLY